MNSSGSTSIKDDRPQVNSVKSNKSRGFSATIDSWLVNLSRTGRSSKQAVSILVDITLVIFSLWCAYSLRLNTLFADFSSTWHLFLLLPVLTVLITSSLGIYRWIIRSSNRRLFYQLGKACLLSSITLVLLSFVFPPDGVKPRSIFIIYGLMLVVSTFCVRLFWQWLFASDDKGEPVAVYGAGTAGTSLLQSLDEVDEFRPVLVFDDNPAYQGTMVAGVRVYDPSGGQLSELLAEHDVSRVILAMPSLSAVEYEKKVDLVRQAGVSVQTVPTYSEIVSGTAKMEQVRDISIKDILGRSEVPPNIELLSKCVENEVVMVTGAGGSIGSELCRQIIGLKPRRLIAVDHSEENLYKISEELAQTEVGAEAGSDVYCPVLCSITNSRLMNKLMALHAVTTVYHSAAYKHVPIIEAQPEQGVRVNVFGTLTLLDAAIANSVDNFVLISTDKAVRPTNAMGASKRTAELILQAKARIQNRTKISMVRFGNVLGSSGSVVPKFKKQIEQGGPITLTDPNVTRFFMTIPEAAQLVLQASSIAKGGDVFVLDMGEPVRIEDLAVSMVRMSGKRLQKDTGNENDIEIVVQGLRPGEKMYEELFISESQIPTGVKKVFSAQESWMRWSELRSELDELITLLEQPDRSGLRAKLLDLAFYGQDVDSELANKEAQLVELSSPQPAPVFETAAG